MRIASRMKRRFIVLHLAATPIWAQQGPQDLHPFFSPKGGCTQAVVSALDSAKKTILVQAYSFTSAPIAKALVEAKKRGVNVQVILDKSQRTERYTSATFLANEGVPTYIDSNHAIAHNKLMVIDGDEVITGSFNFTKSAEGLLDLVRLSGDERVLDIGCGRGLMVVGAAKRLPHGKAVGIDIWQAEDQSDNHQDAALYNASLEGVADRIEVQTADMRQLPFPDQSFDAIVSHWAVHNLYSVDERATALAEINRVLKTDGRVILADIEHHTEYAAGFARLGFIDIQHIGESPKTAFLSAISFGSFCPTAVLARKRVSPQSTNDRSG